METVIGRGAGQESSSSCEVEGVVTSGVLVEPVLPEVSGAAAGVNAAQGEEVLGAGDRPPHARLFAAGADDGFAAGLDDPGADEQSLPAKRAVLHARDVVHEIAQGRVDRRRLGAAAGLPSAFVDEPLDAVAQESLGPTTQPRLVVGVLGSLACRPAASAA